MLSEQSLKRERTVASVQPSELEVRCNLMKFIKI